MKNLKIVIGLLLAGVIIFAVAIFIIIQTVNINQYKDSITQTLSSQLHRQVSIDKLSLSFNKGFWLNVSGLNIADDKKFQEGALLKARSLDLTVDVLALLTRREIVVSKINLNEPDLKIVRNKAGGINVQSLADVPSGKSLKKSTLKTTSHTQNAAKQPSEALKLFVKSVKISNAQITFLDQSLDPPVLIPLKNLNFTVTDFSLTRPFFYAMSCSLWHSENNVTLNGKAQLDVKNGQLRADDLKVKFILEGLDLNEMNKNIPIIANLGLEKKVEGKMTFDIQQMILGEEGLLVLSLDGRIIHGKLWSSLLATPVEYINSDFEVSESDLLIKAFSMAIASGWVKFNGRVNELFKERNFLFNMTMSDIKIEELVNEKDLPAKVQGRINGKFDGKGQIWDEKTLKESLNIQGNLDMKDGKIFDLNILKFVLSKIPGGDQFVDVLGEKLPDRYKDFLLNKDTIINQFHVETQVIKDSVTIKQALIQAGGYSVNASGKIDFDQNVSLDASLSVPVEMSQEMVSSVSQLSGLLDSEKQLGFPLKGYQGKLENLKMYPDIEKIAKKLVQQEGKEQIKNVIFKALKIENGNSGDTQPPTDQDPISSPGKEIIENILDKVLK